MNIVRSMKARKVFRRAEAILDKKMKDSIVLKPEANRLITIKRSHVSIRNEALGLHSGVRLVIHQEDNPVFVAEKWDGNFFFTPILFKEGDWMSFIHPKNVSVRPT